MRQRYSPQTVAVSSGLLSIGCFLLFLATPFFRFSGSEPWLKFSHGNDPWPGLLVLGLGWLWVIGGVVSWLANPIGFVALVLLFTGRYRAASVAGGVALVVALSTSFLTSMNTNFGGGGGSTIWSMGIGYYLWLCAIAIVLLSSLYGMQCQRFAPNSGVQPTPEIGAG